jgi:hypothetical protein
MLRRKHSGTITVSVSQRTLCWASAVVGNVVMAPSELCFSFGMPLAGASPARPALSPRVAGGRPVTSRASVRMTVTESPKKESLYDWFMVRFMHNFQEDGEDYGYEPYFKEIMAAREAAKKAEYEKADEE